MNSGKLFDWGTEKELLLSDIDEADFYKFLAASKCSSRESSATSSTKLNIRAIKPHHCICTSCGGLAELIDSLVERKVVVTGTIGDASGLPWNLISRIDKNFKGHAPPDGRAGKP